MLEIIAKRTSQIIFHSLIVLFATIVILTAVNFFTQGAVLRMVENIGRGEEEIKKSVVIGTASHVTSVSPWNFEFHNRLVLNNVYEGLVQLDQNLQPRQGLAVTFGEIDANTWEFRLREGVKFHDGSEMSAHDVIKSFKSAKEGENSQLKSILANVENIEAKAGKVIIKTYQPDPTFLSKLATAYVVKDYDNGQVFGTGPYKFAMMDEERNRDTVHQRIMLTL